MSLPNDDDNDHWGRQPPHFGKGDPSDFYKDSRILMSPSSEDNATAAETSVGSSSVISGISSVAPGDYHAVDTPAPAAPPQTPSNAVALRPPQHIQRPASAQNNTSSSAPSQPSMSTVIHQRDRYLRQLRQLGIASGATLALTILILFPPAVLAASMVFLMVMAMFFYKLYQMLQWEYQVLVQGRGIGDYLPSSIYEQLTQTTVHDFMSDTRNSYVNENAYLMLYMIPGLTPDQINEYVGRLSPRHQELLHRHGLGHVLGNSFMRFIMGDERLNVPRIEQLEDDGGAATSGSTDSPASSLSNGSNNNSGAGHHNIVPRRLELPPTIPEGASEDSESATSELRQDEDPAAHYARFWGMEPEAEDSVPPSSTTTRRRAPSATPSSTPVVISSQRAASLTRDAQSASQQQQQQQSQDAQSTTSSEARAAEAEAEEQVIYDAIGSAVATYMGVAANMVQTSARRSATLFSGTLFRASMGMTLLGVGVGIYGFWTGTYNPQTFFQPAWQMIQSQVGAMLRPPRRLEMPQSQDLIGLTAFSGATAGIMLLFQLGNAREEDKKKSPDCSKHGLDNGKGGTPNKKQL